MANKQSLRLHLVVAVQARSQIFFVTPQSMLESLRDPIVETVIREGSRFLPAGPHCLVDFRPISSYDRPKQGGWRGGRR
jgi:hypothetical protein